MQVKVGGKYYTCTGDGKVVHIDRPLGASHNGMPLFWAVNGQIFRQDGRCMRDTKTAWPPSWRDLSEAVPYSDKTIIWQNKCLMVLSVLDQYRTLYGPLPQEVH